MSARTKEKFWMELKVLSNIRTKELAKFKISDEDLNIIEHSKKRNLQFIMRNEEAYKLFLKKMPNYLREAIAQVYQEIEIESNPYWIKLLLDKEADKIFHRFLAGFGLEPLESEEKKGRQQKRFKSDYERIFYKDLVRKASISELDKTIISSENRIDKLVYLFDGQTILRNSVFFDLFQHWFDFPGKVERIDELIKELKKKADIKPGPPTFSKKEIHKIIFRYEYLRRIFSKIKRVIKEPNDEDEAGFEWNKLITFLRKNNYFNIEKEITFYEKREVSIGKDKVKIGQRKTDKKALEYLGNNWLKKNARYFQSFFLIDKNEDTALADIKEYQRSKIPKKEREAIKKRVKIIFLEEYCRSQLDIKEYVNLERNIITEDYSLKHLYNKHSLRKIGSFEQIEFMFNKIEDSELNKIIKSLKISPKPHIKLEALREIRYNIPSDLAIFLLSNVYSLTPLQINRFLRDYRIVKEKARMILGHYPQL